MNDAPQPDAERIAKAIARAGVCSRREAEAWIVAGRVSVNGKVITSPALDVRTSDHIAIDGEPLPQRQRTRLFLYHKPRGLVTTNVDPEGRPTIFAALPKNLPRLVTVGRLDINSEGLLLLTNDGGLARVLELPQTAWLRRYRVRAHGEIAPDRLAGLRDGITVDGVRYGSIEATLDRPQGSNVWITFAMREGKNREVRNVLGALGLAVNRLIRVSYGPFQLGEIPEGGVFEVPTKHLREQIGASIAAAAGADFTGPILREPAPDSGPPPARRGEPKPRRHDGRRTRGPRAVAEAEREPEKPRKRRQSPHHVWREEGKPVRARFHGARAERRDADAPRGRGDTDVLSDRKGRKVSVVRFGAKPPDDKRASRRKRDDRKHGRPGARNRRAFDRRSGPRPSRPRES
ncbi:MAG: pseudouridine synthase [Xanthobacteraceae bacterium]|nr:pseudouridine synthase [Xanthobacteraceae bacterium]